MSTLDSDFVHRFIAADGQTTSTNPTTLLLLHGTGGDENDLIPLGRMIAPSASILSPRGKVSENGANRFFRRLAEGVLDQEDLEFRTTELAAFVETSKSTYAIEGSPLIAVGFSNGANIAVSLLLRQPGLLRGAILLSPMLPFEPDSIPNLAGTAVFIGAGQLDPLVTEQQIVRLNEIFLEAKSDVQLHYERFGHTITASEVTAAQEWFQHQFPAAPV